LSRSKIFALLAVFGIVAVSGFAAGCGSDSEDAANDPPQATGNSGTTGNPPTDTSQASPGSREQAGQIALTTVENRFGGPASVTGIEAEDDGGARWEVEVTKGDGSEFDVLVNADGEVIRVVTKGRSGSGGSSGEGSGGQQAGGGQGSVSRQQAGQTALAYIEQRYGQSARITYSGPEDDAGAAWEIEVTLDDGREFDVLVSASNEVIRARTK
jgi:uncharacterized membrane protein YkoI